MANSGISLDTIQKLYDSGHISEDLYSSLSDKKEDKDPAKVSTDSVDAGLRDAAKKPAEDNRLAANDSDKSKANRDLAEGKISYKQYSDIINAPETPPPAPQPKQEDAPLNPVVPPVSPEAAFAAQPKSPSWLNGASISPDSQTPPGVVKAPEVVIAGKPAGKAPVGSTSVGPISYGQAPANATSLPNAPPLPGAATKPVGSVNVPGQGSNPNFPFSSTPVSIPGNRAYGPVNANAFLSPGEVSRQAQLKDESQAAKNLTGREGDILSREQDEINTANQERTLKEESAMNDQIKFREHYQKVQDDNFSKLYDEQVQLGQQKIDPNRAWKNMSTGNQIVAGISMLLGGAAGGASGRGNEALAAINNAMTKDINAQEFDIKNKGASLAARKGLLDARWEQFKDMDLAKSATRIDYLKLAEMKVKDIAGKYTNEKTKLNVDKALQEIDTQLHAEQDKFSQLNDGRARQAAAAAAANAAAGQARLLEDYKARRDAVLNAYKEGKIQNPDGSIPSVADVLASLGSPGGGGQYITGAGKTTPEELSKRTVVVTDPGSGKSVTKLAINADAAKKYHEYSQISPEAKRLLSVMKENAGNVTGGAAYDAARAKLIEIMPTLYGYARGPSVAQVEHTFGPESIPDFASWLHPVNLRSTKIKLDDLEKTIGTIDNAMQTSTFAPPAASAAPTTVSELNSKFGAKPLR